MNTPKPFYKSTGVVGGLTGIVSALVALAAALASRKGVEIDGETQALIVSIVVALAGCVASLIGRLKAVQPVVREPRMSLEDWLARVDSSSAGAVIPIPRRLEKAVAEMHRVEVQPDVPWERPKKSPGLSLVGEAGPTIESRAASVSRDELAAAMAALTEAVKAITPPAQPAAEAPANPNPTDGGSQ